MKFKRVIHNLIRKPFAGCMAYEWQILGVVILWTFKYVEPEPFHFHTGKFWQLEWGHLNIFADPEWHR